MSKNIIDGKLIEMSPSMITSFDAETAFGCERKGFFKYVMGLPEPQTGNQELGEDLHKLCEERLLTGKTPVGEGEAFGLYLAGQAMIEQVASRKILAVEAALPPFEISGVKLKGYIDVVTGDGIIDWKTSSDIRRYGKSASDLATDTQMVLYAKACHEDKPTVKLAHGQFQTKGRKSTDFVEVEVTQEHLDDHIRKVIIPKVERMKVVAAMTDARDATPDFKKCFNCAFRPRCPKPESEAVMGFFDKIRTSPAALVNAGDMAVKSAVKPPDAPQSKPELAADPVAGFEALPPPRRNLIVDKEGGGPEKVKFVAAMITGAPDHRISGPDEVKTEPKLDAPAFKGESDTERAARGAMIAANEAEVKRGRGRPPGAKNKPKESAAAPIIREMQESAEKFDSQYAAHGEGRQFKSITISKGATINVGNFNSVRFDVSVTSEEHTYEEVYAEVHRRLDEEAAKYQAEVAKGSTVSASGVVSK